MKARLRLDWLAGNNLPITFANIFHRSSSKQTACSYLDILPIFSMTNILLSFSRYSRCG
jgi:hypothetical protein